MVDEIDPSTGRDERPAIKIMRFFTKYKPDRTSPGKMAEEHWVEWVIKGDQHASMKSEKVSRLAPKIYEGPEGPKERPPSVEWPIVGPAYEAWKNKQEAPIVGTPLAAWPGMTHELAEALRPFNFTSVEDVANMTESVMARVNIPGIRQIKEHAIAFLRAQGDTAAIEAALVSRDDKIAAQEREMAEMRAMLESLTAPKDDAKRGPGRPRKDTVEEAA